MTTTINNRNLVVIQLAGANDPLNTVIPYADGHYYDFRPNVGIPTEQVIPIAVSYTHLTLPTKA